MSNVTRKTLYVKYQNMVAIFVDQWLIDQFLVFILFLACISIVCILVKLQ